MANTNIYLTDLEKKVLRDCLDEGYAFDDINDSFVTWGPIYGKQERGAASSLVKKGVLNIDEWDGDIYINCAGDYTITDLVNMSGYEM